MEPLSIAWIACLVCIILCAKTATVFCKRRPRLFTAFALFALVWALLLPYYDKNTTSSEMFPALGGFVLVYIGGLLSLEASKSSQSEETVDTIQRVGIWLLLLIASPSVLGLKVPGGNTELNRIQTELFLGTVLDIAGYISVAYGCWRLCGKRVGILISAFLITYSLTEVLHAVAAWNSKGGGGGMTNDFLYLFAAEKLIFTFAICCLVSKTVMSDADSKRGFFHWCMLLSGFRSSGHPLTPDPVVAVNQ